MCKCALEIKKVELFLILQLISPICCDREKKRKRLALTESKPDAVYVTTIMMMSCLILSLPYDLPDYLPALLISLLRHGSTAAFKDTVTKTVQVKTQQE